MWSRSFGMIWFCLYLQQTIETDSDYSTVTEEVSGTTIVYENEVHNQIVNCSSLGFIHPQFCNCYDCTDGTCILHCRTSVGMQFCYCYTCENWCWNGNWGMVSLAQTGLSIALLFAIIATIALFYRICLRDVEPAPLTGPEFLGDYPQGRVSISSTQRFVIDRLRDRPPCYNEISDAPPLYGNETSGTAMSEAPPVYPGTQESRETIGESVATSAGSSRNLETSRVDRPPVAQHI